jgi:hypothetical protein
MDQSELWGALQQVRPFTVAKGVRTFYSLYAEKHGKTRFGDKTPLYALDMPAIRSLLPEVRFVHIIRDGRDVALSLRKMWFAPSQEITELASYWMRIVTTARTQGRNSDAYLELRYEDLLSETAENLRRICRFLKLDFDASMLQYWKAAPLRLQEHEGRYGPDGNVILTQQQRLQQQHLTIYPPQQNRARAWRQAMSAGEAASFRSVAGGLLAELGYEND